MIQVLAVLCLILPYDLSVEYMNNPVGIDTPKPRLSWKSQAADDNAKNLKQTAYEILVASSPEMLAANEGDLWATGKIASDRSLNIEYGGKPLQSSQRCYWKVRVWDNQSDTPSAWSRPAFWVMGIMKPDDWKANWVSIPEKYRPDYDMTGAKWIRTSDVADLWQPQGDRYFRAEFDVPENLEYDSVILAITADDGYEVDINGKRATQTWGHFNDWSWLRFINVAEHFKPGKNVIAVKVNNKEPGPTALVLKLTAFNSKITAEKIDPSKYLHPFYGEAVETLLVTNDAWVSAATKDAEYKTVTVVGDIDCEPWRKIKRTVNTAPYSFMHHFELKNRSGIKEATLHITGLGFYEVGFGEMGPTKKTGNKVLDPIPTRYDKRVLYSTYDVTDEVQAGHNFMFVQLGHGWYDVRSVAVWNYDNAPWRDFPRFISQLEITFWDGEKTTVASNEENCFCFPSFFDFDCIRQGVVWGLKSFSGAQLENGSFGKAANVPVPKGVLSAESMPGSVITEELKPIKIWEPKPGVYVADFGQNIAGWVRFNFDGKTDDEVRLVYTERLKPDGNVDMRPINQHFRHGVNEFQNDVIRTFGGTIKNFEPKFIYHGFQYVEITGLQEPLKPEHVTACVIHTDFKQVGNFECSNDLFNWIQHATLWAYRGNFVNGYPTDCPHREKNGWTGDAQLAAEQAMYNWQNTAAYEKWMQDFRDEQRGDGNVPGIVPTSGWGYAWGNGPAWDSAYVLIPWYLYIYQGDTRVLEQNYDGMKKYVDYMTSRVRDNGLINHGLGDWVFAKTQTPTEVTSTGYYYVDTMIVAQAAKVLGKTDDAKKYSQQAENIRKAYNRELKKDNGVYANGSQTSQSTPIHQRLADPADYPAIAERLVEQVEQADNHLDVGILGAKYLFRTLSEMGRTDVAMRIANQRTKPSYGEWYERGATTLWEDWRDGDSRNHIMFGDISAWFYQTLAGIQLPPTVSAVGQPSDSSAIAFKKFVIKPVFADGLDWVKASTDTPYGLIESSWQRDADKVTLNVTVPVNTEATVILPNGKTHEIGSGKYTFVTE